MGEACSTSGGDEKCIKIFLGKTDEESTRKT
jgi:hypothetical protein